MAKKQDELRFTKEEIHAIEQISRMVNNSRMQFGHKFDPAKKAMKKIIDYVGKDDLVEYIPREDNLTIYQTS